MGINSPSKFARRVQCPGSGLLEATLPKPKSSVYADEGTAAHKVAETCFKNRTNVHHMVGIRYPLGSDNDFVITEDFTDAIDTYLEHIRMLDAISDEVFVEERYNLSSFLGDGEFGLADFVAVTDSWIEVVDYKHGSGIPVEAINNVQGLCYAIGAGMKHKHRPWKTLKITIVQPRCYHKDGPIRTWELSKEEAVARFREYKNISKNGRTATELVVGKDCKWCIAKCVCPAQRQMIIELMRADIFAGEVAVTPDMLKPEEIRELLLTKLRYIRDWCNSVEEYAKAEAEAGRLPPGMKLVGTRPLRYFRNSVSADLIMERFELGEEDVYEPRKMRSVAQIEKRVGKKLFKGQSDDIVEKRSSGTTLVDEDDPRPPAKTPGVDDFDGFDVSYDLDDLLE